MATCMLPQSPPGRQAGGAPAAGGECSRLDLAVYGMDCPSCAAHVERAVRQLPGVREVSVLVGAGRATVLYEGAATSEAQIEGAIRAAGYATSPCHGPAPGPERRHEWVAWAVLAVVVLLVSGLEAAEALGAAVPTAHALPWWVAAAGVLLGGGPAFLAVGRNLLRRSVTPHTLLALGAAASAATGEWTTALLVVFFMRFADFLEGLTARRSREGLRLLAAMRPETARVLRESGEEELAVGEIRAGDLVRVRPGDRIAVDGTVLDGHAPVDESPVTGESVPVEKQPGDRVYAASVAQAGSLTIRAERVGSETAFARVVRLVEEAETRKAPVQKLAERFAAWYLPAVVLVALATFAVSRQVQSAVSVLVVACACSIALATPLVVLAAVGHAARRGVLIKGGAALEQLARVDTLAVDKTGTLTTGRPRLTDLVPLDGGGPAELLAVAASLERRSEHPVAHAVLRAAAARRLAPAEPERFEVLPGRGVRGTVEGRAWALGSRRLLSEEAVPLDERTAALSEHLEAEGKTVFYLAQEGRVRGLLAVADTLRPGVREALAAARAGGIRRVVLLTGDGERVAAALARELDVEYRAGLLPDEKIAAVRELQAAGGVVLMVGDGINDGPALAQADVGVALAGSGTQVAAEAADVALLRDDWSLVPEVLRLGRRCARTIRQNLAISAAYNLAGLALAAGGLLPPILAAALHNLPDLLVLLNSARLFRGERAARPPAPREAPARSAAHEHVHTHGHTHCHGHSHAQGGLE